MRENILRKSEKSKTEKSQMVKSSKSMKFVNNKRQYTWSDALPNEAIVLVSAEDECGLSYYLDVLSWQKTKPN